MIVSLWTDKVVNFGQTSTSRVEASHAKMKKWLETGRADIYSFIMKLTSLWSQVSSTLSQVHSSETMTLPFRYQDPFYAPCLRRISTYALSFVFDEIKWANQELKYLEQQRKKQSTESSTLSSIEPFSETNNIRSICTGVYTHTMGTPCRHRLRDLKEQGLSLEPKEFHKHWWLDRSVDNPQTSSPILEFTTQIRSRFKRNGTWSRKTGSGKYGSRREELVSEQRDQNSTINQSRRRRERTRLRPLASSITNSTPNNSIITSANPTPSLLPNLTPAPTLSPILPQVQVHSSQTNAGAYNIYCGFPPPLQQQQPAVNLQQYPYIHQQANLPQYQFLTPHLQTYNYQPQVQPCLPSPLSFQPTSIPSSQTNMPPPSGLDRLIFHRVHQTFLDIRHLVRISHMEPRL